MSKEIELWKVLSTKTLLDHKGFTIIEDLVLFPNGKESTYIHRGPSKTDSVAIIAINEKGRALIQREYSHPPNKVMWQLPGGRMDMNETIKAAANRELAEESGYQAKKLQIIGAYYTNNRLWDQRQHVVVATELFKNKLAHDADEFIENHWMTKEELKSKIKSGEFDNINLLASLNFWFHSN